jgi:hypothetical protein
VGVHLSLTHTVVGPPTRVGVHLSLTHTVVGPPTRVGVHLSLTLPHADGYPTRPFRRTTSLLLLTGSRRRFCATPPPALCATTTSAREDKKATTTTTRQPLIACSAVTTGVTSMTARQVGSSGAPELNRACRIHNVRVPLPARPTLKAGVWWWWVVVAVVVGCIFVVLVRKGLV